MARKKTKKTSHLSVGFSFFKVIFSNLIEPTFKSTFEMLKFYIEKNFQKIKNPRKKTR